MPAPPLTGRFISLPLVETEVPTPAAAALLRPPSADVSGSLAYSTDAPAAAVDACGGGGGGMSRQLAWSRCSMCCFSGEKGNQSVLYSVVSCLESRDYMMRHDAWSMVCSIVAYRIIRWYSKSSIKTERERKGEGHEKRDGQITPEGCRRAAGTHDDDTKEGGECGGGLRENVAGERVRVASEENSALCAREASSSARRSKALGRGRGTPRVGLPDTCSIRSHIRHTSPSLQVCPPAFPRPTHSPGVTQQTQRKATITVSPVSSASYLSFGVGNIACNLGPLYHYAVAKTRGTMSSLART